jgi:dTDP-glucose pyrophosphorylase
MGGSARGLAVDEGDVRALRGLAHDARATTILVHAPIAEAVRQLDATDLEELQVLDPAGQEIGVVSDLDVRRALLRGVGLDDAIGSLLPTEAGAPVMAGSGRASIPLTDRWVVLMAGGRGRRLHPLTEECPKPLLEVGGRPLLESTVEGLAAYGFRRFFISVNYRAEMIEARLGDGSRWGVRIEYLRELNRLGTAGSLGLLPSVPDGGFLVMNADLLTNLDLSRLLRFHDRQGLAATVCVCGHDVQVPFGVVGTDNDRLTSIEERPRKRFVINAGIYVLEPSSLGLFPSHQPFDMPELLKRLLAQVLPVGVYPIREYWCDIGSQADLERANLDFPFLSHPKSRPF